MPFRIRAFALHLGASLTLLTGIFATLYFGWYRWPGWYLSLVLHVVGIVALVDLALGPSLTLLVANPTKPRRHLARDISVIVLVQLTALVYGVVTLWLGRPLYYAFSANRLQLVQASDLDQEEIALARRVNATLAPYWDSRPRWVWAALPDDPQEAQRIVQSALLGGGRDVETMPRYYRAWTQGLPALRAQLKPLSDVLDLSDQEKRQLGARMREQRMLPEERNALLLSSGLRHVVVIFDTKTLQIRAILGS